MNTGTAITSDGVHIAFEFAGEGSPIVFIHGLGDDRRLWASIIDRLRHRYTCVSLDLRGHGESRGARDYDPFGLDRDIAAVVSSLALSAPLVVGHSLGGFAATLFAARHAAAAVVNVDQPLALAALSANVQALSERIHAGRISEVLWSVLEGIGLGPLPSAVIERLRATRMHFERDVLLGLWRPLLQDDPEELARAVDRAIDGIEVPYLGLQGAALDAGYVDWLRARIPGATLETWDGLGHFPHLVDPERFARRIDEYAQLTAG